MKKKLLAAFCLFALMTTSASLMAQEITINLNHGWRWISYTRADTLTFAEALGYFTPAEGDIIKSQNSNSVYRNGRWRGSLQQFHPGLGYMYYSNRTEPISFVYTHAYQPEVSTGSVSGITATSATVGGNLLNDGGATMQQCGICWGTNENPTVNNNIVTLEELASGEYALELANLIPGTTYHARAFATNTVGTAYGENMSFTTAFVLPTVTTDEASWVTTTTAIVGGQFSFVGNCFVTECGVCYRTEEGEETCIADSTNTSPFSINLADLLPNTTYIVRAYATNEAGTSYGEEVSFTTLNEGNEHAYVDLGLPSGLLWATCNVGAEAPEQYGDYFAWGETQPKDTYTLDNYQYYGSVIPIELTKYCNNSNYGYNGFADNLTTLLPEDDAATSNWGSDWRMPTKEECQELYNNTTHTWTTQNGVNGCLFTASNGNSLFLPAAGYRGDSNLINAFSYGYYWSSSLSTDIPIVAWKFYFNYEHYYDGVYTDNRHFGFTVRPVRSASQNTSFSIDATANPTEGGTVMGGGTYEQGQSCTLTATPNVGYTFTNWTEGGEVVSTDAIYTFTVNDNRTLLANFVVSGGGNHAYVDLGLPSGLLWATCNVGAEAPEQYGDYFAWGETQPKDTYNSTSYQYSEDDAATANWGNGWRMPTKEEWEELYNNTTSTWTTQNGVNGRLFTANNGNSIFLPAAGYRQNSGLAYAGSYAGYWSSSLYTDDLDNAWVFRFTSGYYNMARGNRYLGLSVRPVRVGSQSTSFIINATANPSEGGEVNGGGTYEEGAECTLTATANEGYSFTNWTENGEVFSVDATYSFTVNGDRNLVANFVVSGGGNHAYVDLGLPSGLLWATCNVGANSPEDYGDYFAWGETQPKDTYSWSTYQHCNGSSSTLTKYCSNSSYGYNGFTDNLTTLLPEDDAATANWGSDWRMPTKEEWQELYQNTTHTWTTQNGVNGRLFTASNGNSLFLPAAGYRYYSNLSTAGSHGYYWSSSLYTDCPYIAWRFDFTSGGYNVVYDSRQYGRSVRPVRVGSQSTSFIINATANPSEGGTATGGGTYEQGQSCTVTATANAGYTFTNWTENGTVVSTNATYTFTVNADRSLLANFIVSSGGNHAYVDLGLPSGLLWATCNVGADNPEDYGDYFAWGETQPKDTYNWSTYQYCMGSYNTMTKYCSNSSYGYNGFTDNLTTLLPEDDAATANWGSGWRMPTKEEWQELYNNTTVTWTTQNGVNGRLFTASNGNSLFLPAAGFRSGSSLYDAGSYGSYWSSSLRTDYQDIAWRLYFNSGSYNMSNGDRYYGQSVRPVCSSRQN